MLPTAVHADTQPLWMLATNYYYMQYFLQIKTSTEPRDLQERC